MAMMKLPGPKTPYIETGVLFIVGVASLIIALFILLLDPNAHQRVLAERVLMVPLGFSIFALVFRAFLSHRHVRWVNVLAAGVLLLLFSGFALPSFGILTLPVALVTVVVAIAKLSKLGPPVRRSI